MSIQLVSGQDKTIWQVGNTDGSSKEFALSPGNYKKFLEHDFGYEDRSFIIGQSSPIKDLPYVLPGPANEWGGTGGTSGLRTHFLNLNYVLNKTNKGKWTFEVNLANSDPKHIPTLQISINGEVYNYELKKGAGTGEPISTNAKSGASTITLALPAHLVRPGFNQITLTVIKGGWIEFDSFRLSGPQKARLLTDYTTIVKQVQQSDFEVKNGNERVQYMLVDLLKLKDDEQVKVILDGQKIYEETQEKGTSRLEIPMPYTSKKVQSRYAIYSNDQLISSDTITRGPKRLGGVSDYVNTMIGAAHSRWMLAPGPWMPFGMVKISPDNQNIGWQAGYEPSIESIGTFSHIHEWTMAGLGTFPTAGPLKTRVGDQYSTNSGYRSAIDKTTERAPLGYYAVHLIDHDIDVKLTAGTRSSFQKYTYHKSDTGRIMVDLKVNGEYDYKIKGLSLKKISDYKIVGYSNQLSENVWSTDAKQDYVVYFVMEFDRPIINYGTWHNDKIRKGADLMADSAQFAGMFVEFDVHSDKDVQLRTGISYVSIANAEENLATELSDPFGWSFDQVVANQHRVWDELLGRLEIKTSDYLEKEKFYTNMYRTLASRNTFSDVNGQWRSSDEVVQTLAHKDDLALGCDAFWNTFWNLNQFWNLVTPEWSNKWVRSQLAMYDANGWLAKGPAGMEYIPVMVAEHEIPLIVGAYQMGIRDYDVSKAFHAVKKMQMTSPSKFEGGFAGNRDLDVYLKYKYVPYDLGRFSNSMEYSFDDWTVGQFAKSLGKDTDYNYFNERGTWWKNAIDVKSGYARMKDAKGEWYKDFDPFKSGANHHYVEGNAWQLTFFVPQDIPALAQMIGEDVFLKRLEWGFGESEKWRYNGPNDQYWDYPVVQGNQQSMHFAYIFNWLNKPWLTQKWSRSIGERYYGQGISNAYLGDEDQGQMSAWYVMNAIGLFQLDGGTRAKPIYEIGSPSFEEIKIKLDGRYGRGSQFVIKAKNASKRNMYVQGANLNGKPLHTFYFNAEELLKGGELILEMGDKPNMQWGLAHE
ncbi:GH92 family glycosyl hydrolase [Sphingobacterium sp. N143]|uniref:GH92 family glycosyl hydrolase n=1 Tax=Sphingobacterium sp. N143 TaxID=2746727 RepID=UPI0025759DCB|nr:GH92 family glycosyl hydrolase [Sphingobacterium sp. N143]